MYTYVHTNVLPTYGGWQQWSHSTTITFSQQLTFSHTVVHSFCTAATFVPPHGVCFLEEQNVFASQTGQCLGRTLLHTYMYVLEDFCLEQHVVELWEITNLSYVNKACTGPQSNPSQWDLCWNGMLENNRQ